MSSSTSSTAEQLSALADGQLQGPELDQALRACQVDDVMLDRWRDYHLIGDVLRGTSPLAHADEAAFLARLRPALQLTQPVAQPLQAAPTRQAANAPRWRWAAGFASVALVAGAAWSLLGANADGDELALGESPVLAQTAQGVIVRDAALEELMEAHRQQGGASVLPMPSGFLRNATFEAEPAAVARVPSR